MKVEHDVYLMLLRAKTLNDIDAWLFAMKDNHKLQADLINSIKDRLFKEGVDEDRRVLGTYSAFTEKLNPKKKVGTRYTLFDTGEFYSSIYIQVMNDYFLINGDGDKGDENLFDKFGDGIIGLDENLFDWFSDEIINKYREYADRILFGN